jgi:O-antigen/teichoic acid export membrane protein
MILAESNLGFAKSSFIYLASAAMSAAIPFLILPFMTRWLGTADFGRLGTYLSLVNVFGAAIGLSTHGLVSVAYYRDGPEKSREYTGTAIGIAFFLAGLSSIVLYLGSPFVETASAIPRLWVPTLAAAALGQFVFFVALSVFQVRGEPLRYAALQISFALILAILSMSLVGLLDLGLEGRFLAQIIASMTLLISVLLILSVYRLIEWNPRRWHFREALAFGLPTVPHALGAIWMITVDRLALTYGATAHEAGLYFLAVQIATVLSMFGMAVNQAWLPRLYSLLADNSPNVQRAVVKSIYLVISVIFTISLILIISAPAIIAVAGGDEYASSYPFVILLVVGYMFSSCYFFVAGILFFHSRTGLLAWVTVGTALLQTALTPLFMHFFGPIGVAWATLSASAFYFAATWIASQSVHPLPWLRFMEKADRDFDP